ncbi:hypothetical protein C8P63_11258 [Melghirimyces profundicolus]|uniref:LiaF transmembrane domain-containing protein n=1 Tax=Melghirimyces profundicolus TaxID=1242148 RepID=A0A2T6BTH7_9BACL|nr:hypothetical protein [Melghirimyces profundicolus]PTX59363.1 hypothetical protein C8P63_11258 [Melghirimyces profundicolus]
MRSKTFGILIALVGVLLLLRELGYPVAAQVASWEFLLIVAGILIIVYSFSKPKNPHLMIWGGIMTGLGIHAWGINRVEGWPTHWSLVPAIIGASFLIFGGLVRKNQRQGTVGAILLLLGVFAWPGVSEIPGLGQAAVFLNTYWPGLLIILGLVMAFRR